jgi:hypothetical protein
VTQDPSARDRRDLRHVGATLVWVLVVLAIALGAAGLVTATPSAGLQAARPELTGVADAAATRQLDVAEADLSILADQVDTLGTQARGALSALVGGLPETVDSAVAKGDDLLVQIGTQATVVQADLDAAPYAGGPAADLHVSPAVQARYAQLELGLAAVRDLDTSWANLTTGAVSATRVSTSLAEHDRLVGLAAEQGRAARYKDALTYLTQAGDQITAARALRTQLAKTVDVTVLDQWLDRNATYDKALRGLYVALNKVSGRVTKAVRDAIAAEKAARQQLPPDSRALIVIIGEIGQGGMNGAVITIEEAKAKLADALAPAPAPSAVPGAPSAAP